MSISIKKNHYLAVLTGFYTFLVLLPSVAIATIEPTCSNNSTAFHEHMVNPTDYNVSDKGNLLIWNQSKDIVVSVDSIFKITPHRRYRNCFVSEQKGPPTVENEIYISYTSAQGPPRGIRITYAISSSLHEKWRNGDVSSVVAKKENDKKEIEFERFLKYLREKLREFR